MPGAEAEIKEIWAILRHVAERQAAAEARMDRADARAAEMDARFDKRMRGFEKLVKIGMRELADLRKFARQLDERTDHKINALIDAQQRTEASLRAFLDSRRTRNGHNGGRGK
jgi:chromosome segregation ATPase